jgi:hypothetical protein
MYPTTTAAVVRHVRNDAFSTPLDVLDATRPYHPDFCELPTDADFDALYAERYGEGEALVPPEDLPPVPPRLNLARRGPDYGDLVRVNTNRVVMAAGHAGFVALTAGQLGKVMGFAEGVTYCEFNGSPVQARVVDDSILDVVRRNLDMVRSWDREALEDGHYAADLNTAGDSTDPTPAEVLDRSAPWCSILSPARGEFTFGVLRDGWDVTLADEDLERQDREQTLADLAWQAKALEIDRLYALASIGYGHPEYRGTGAGHDLD